jgi:prolyl-tRNA synthetase
LQCGTSHNLGQNFARAFDVMFQDKDGKQKLVWATSWGVSTRLIGALIMTHSDDNGLILPPRMAAKQVVIIPIWKDEEQKTQVMEFTNTIYHDLKDTVDVILDDREQYKPGYKYNEWEMQGIPLRIEIGPRDVQENKVVVVPRDTKEKQFVNVTDLRNKIRSELVTMQARLFENARKMRDENTFEISDYEAFRERVEKDNGFYLTHWCGSAACEEKVKEETKATIRLIPFEQTGKKGRCMICGSESDQQVIFAKAY